MKTQTIFIIPFFNTLCCLAQIGINTTAPQAMFDVSSANSGVLFPRVALTANNVTAPIVNPQGGGLVTSTLIYNTATVAGANGVSPGYYYWNGSLWISLSTSNDWKLNGNSTITTPATPISYATSTIGASENFIGTTDNNDVVFGTNNIERMRVKQTTGDIGIGTPNPAYNLHIRNSTDYTAATFSENTFSGNSNGTGIYGRSFNNPGYGTGGYFEGGGAGVYGAVLSSFSGPTFGVKGYASGDGGNSAVRYAGSFRATGLNIWNVGVEGFAYGGTNTTTNFAGLFNATGNATCIGVRSYANGTNINYGGYFGAISGTNNYAIVVPANSGDVGIGTITPTTKLDIVSPNNTLGLRLLSGDNTQYSYLSVGKATEYAQLGACTSGTFFTDALDGDMAIKNYNSGKILLGASYISPSTMAINPNGLVGIGTSIQNRAKLQVEGYVGNTVATFNAAANSNGVAIVSDWPGIYFNSYFDGGTRQMSNTNYPAIINYNPGGQFEFTLSNTLNTTAGNICQNTTGGFANRLILHRDNGAFINYNNVSVTGLTVVSGNVSPNILTFTANGDNADINNGKGVAAGGKFIGVEGRAEGPQTTSTGDKIGGFFYVSSASGFNTFAAVGATIDFTNYKIIGSGIVSTLVKDSQQKERIMVAPEAPEALFQDFGSGKLINGYAKINIDPILAKNIKVDDDHPLKVFVQLEGDCNGVYVFNKSAFSFEVKELQNGNSTLSFSYQIVASRADEERNGMVSKYSDMRFKYFNRELKTVDKKIETESNFENKMTLLQNTNK